jgi:hypothetical protein
VDEASQVIEKIKVVRITMFFIYLLVLFLVKGLITKFTDRVPLAIQQLIKRQQRVQLKATTSEMVTTVRKNAMF